MSDQPHRQQFEEAARRFFDQLRTDVDLPKPPSPKDPPIDWAAQQELSAERAEALTEQLQSGAFDRLVMGRARALAVELGVDVDTLPDETRRLLKSLTARAELEAMRYRLHRIGNPTAEFAHSDPLFQSPPAAPPSPPIIAPTTNTPDVGITIEQAVDLYIKKRRGVLAEQTIVESARVLAWFGEYYGKEFRLPGLDKPRLRDFRDALIQLSKVHQGRGGMSFASRQTDGLSHRISTKTANKYWSFIQSFFAWAERDGHVVANPTSGLRIEIAKVDEGHSAEPFSSDEVKRLLNSPLYRGHQGKLINNAGTSLSKDGHYWSGLIGLFTGARGGEIAQLLTTDFHFDGAVPYISFRYENSKGERVKTLKTQESVRDVPIASTLLKIGLEDWIAHRRKLWGEQRVFREFRLGKNGDMSDGISKWWGIYLRKQGLWKKGRATHVWRHTVTDVLRNAGFANEMIDAIVGHKDGSMTGRYGRPARLDRNAEVVAKIDYGFDIVALLKANELALELGVSPDIIQLMPDGEAPPAA